MSNPQFVILIGALFLIADSCAKAENYYGVMLFITTLALLLGGSFWWILS